MHKIKVKIFGELTKYIGNEHKFVAKNCREIYAALKANFPHFEKFVIEADKQGKHYSLIVRRKDGTEEEVNQESFSHKNLQEGDEVWIIPVILGAFIGLVIGAVLTGAGLLGVGGTAVASFLLKLGLTLLVSGIVSLFADSPKIPTQTSTTSAGANSYFFGGRTNTTQQGQVVPLGYGRLRIGSFVVHTSVTSSDIPTANTKVEDNS